MDTENISIKTEQPDDDFCSIIQEEIHIKEEDLKITNETPYKCGICNHRTTTDTLLKLHVKSHKVKWVHQCDTCKKTFKFVSQLNNHMLTHTEKKINYQCEVCGMDCITEKDLFKHYRVHPSEKPADHPQLHKGEKPYECNICKKRFAKKVLLNQHLLAHSKVKPFKCDVCNKGFVYMCNLKSHVITHTENKPFTCSLCNKSYALKKVLNVHMKYHTKEGIMHKCQFCEQEFRTLYNMKRHVRVHTGEKPYVCPICQMAFSQSATLNRHIEAHENILYRCNICTKAFARKSYLKIHLMSHQGKTPNVHLKEHKKKGPKFRIVQVEPTIKTDLEKVMEIKQTDGDPKSRIVEQKPTIKLEVEDNIETKENYSDPKCETYNEGTKEEPTIKTEAEDDIEIKEELIFIVP